MRNCRTNHHRTLLPEAQLEGAIRAMAVFQDSWKLAAYAAVIVFLWLALLAGSAAAACRPLASADGHAPGAGLAPASVHVNGHADDECCVAPVQAVFPRVLVAGANPNSPEPSTEIDSAVLTEPIPSAPAVLSTLQNGYPVALHPPFYLLYHRLLIPHFS